MTVERAFLIRQAYQKALTALRQKHDDEFQQMLAEQYAQMGLEVAKRKSRVASRTTNPEGDTDG
jgi:hypothetical protein